MIYLGCGRLDLESNGLGIGVTDSERALDVLSEGTWITCSMENLENYCRCSVRLKPRELLGCRLTDILRKQKGKEKKG